MKSINFKALLPHLIAIGIFLLVSVIFCRPALESGVILQQSDVTAVESMRHQSDVYREQTGKYPLWITSMFSGMPAYNIIFDGPISPFQYLNKVLQLWLPKPFNFFYLSCICFYIFCLCLKIRPYTAIMGSLAFAYATYNPILVVAGHDTKLLAMAYAPAVIGGLLLLFEKKYFLGFILTAIFTTLHIMQNHPQISYYLLLVIVVMGLFHVARWIMQKEYMHIAKVLPLGLAAGLLGVFVNAIILFPVLDYSKHSKRGGQLVMDEKKVSGEKVNENKTTGLSREYAFQWSNTKSETLNIMFPGILGYGGYVSKRDDDYNIFPKLTENSNSAKYLQEKLNVPEDQAGNFVANLSLRLYWGDKPGTTGPAYLGVVVCCLFIAGLFFLNNTHKWWMLTACALGAILAMGKSLPSVNNFLFDYLPMYNKFRTPEMAMVIVQFLFPAVAALAIETLLKLEIPNLKKQFKWAVMAIAAVFVLALGLYFSFDYSNENKARTTAITAAFATPNSDLNARLNEINEKHQPLTDNRVFEELLYQIANTPNFTDPISLCKGYVNALRKDRQALLMNNILNGVLLATLTLLVLALFIYKKIKGPLLISVLSILILADLIPIGMKYVNEKSFEQEDKYKAAEFAQTEADKTILNDKDPNFRIYDLTGGDPFQDSKPSYYHKSIGGYHPAKIGIYDDLITYQLSSSTNAGVLNMLNAKYIVRNNEQNKAPMAILNPAALGNCWFVKAVKYVKTPVEEMKALTGLNPKDTAIINEAYQPLIGDVSAPDSNASIKQVKFDNMEIEYASNSSTKNLAVFSEIYYKDWNAYLDGNKVEHGKANYVLRAMSIPAGAHKIVFKFEPQVFELSYKASFITNWILVGLIAIYLFFALRYKRQN
jgi:hypothetical protein